MLKKYIVVAFLLLLSLKGNTQDYNINSIPFSPAPFTGGISLNGTFTGVDDGVSQPIRLPFTFCFYGINYDTCWVGTNGWLSFSRGQPNNFTAAPIPSTAFASVPFNCIMAPWQDWWSSFGGLGDINYRTLGTAPNRRFVVSFAQLPMYGCTQNTGTFQIILYETSNIIEVHIQEKPPCTSWGGTAVLGLHNATGSDAHTVPGRNSTIWTVIPTAPEGWRFEPDCACKKRVFGFQSADTSSRLPVVEATCYEGSVGLKVNSGLLRCESIDSLGSEFRLYDPRGNLMQIRSVERYCVNGETDSLTIFSANAFLFDGDHYLVIRNGIDGNTLLSECDTAVRPFDTIIVRIRDCYRYNEAIQMRNVSVKPDNSGVILTWNTPPNFDSNFFDLYRVFSRAYQPDSLRWSNFADTYAIEDTVIGTDVVDPSVDRMLFRVFLRLRLYGEVRTPGDSISNILLKPTDERLTNGNRGPAQISWNAYDGWNALNYEIYLQSPADTGFGSLIGTTTDTTFSFEKPEDLGWYKIRVRTVDNSSTYAAWSNYVPFELQQREVEVPNVVTPNGDGKNDVFKIKGIEFFPVNTVQLFNRWGQKVFEAQNYQNTYSPTDLESGVYVYKILIPKEQGKEGVIRIIK